MEELIRVAEERGIDVEDLIINAIRSRSNDPTESIRIRLELARRFMTEAREYMSKGNSIQASEKAYKAAEEVVKALAEKYGLPEHHQAIKEGKWYTHQLSTAANKLSRILGNWVLNGWSSAYLLHVWGFHEAKLGVDDIIGYVDEVERMVKEAEKALAH